MPVKVEQINGYLFSDTVQSQKTKSGSDEISQGRGYPSKCSLGQVQTKVEKKNERDEFLVFCERELERWQGVSSQQPRMIYRVECHQRRVYDLKMNQT